MSNRYNLDEHDKQRSALIGNIEMAKSIADELQDSTFLDKVKNILYNNQLKFVKQFEMIVSYMPIDLANYFHERISHYTDPDYSKISIISTLRRIMIDNGLLSEEIIREKYPQFDRYRRREEGELVFIPREDPRFREFIINLANSRVSYKRSQSNAHGLVWDCTTMLIIIEELWGLETTANALLQYMHEIGITAMETAVDTISDRGNPNSVAYQIKHFVLNAVESQTENSELINEIVKILIDKNLQYSDKLIQLMRLARLDETKMPKRSQISNIVNEILHILHNSRIVDEIEVKRDLMLARNKWDQKRRLRKGSPNEYIITKVLELPDIETQKVIDLLSNSNMNYRDRLRQICEIIYPGQEFFESVKDKLKTKTKDSLHKLILALIRNHDKKPLTEMQLATLKALLQES